MILNMIAIALEVKQRMHLNVWHIFTRDVDKFPNLNHLMFSASNEHALNR